MHMEILKALDTILLIYKFEATETEISKDRIMYCMSLSCLVKGR